MIMVDQETDQERDFMVDLSLEYECGDGEYDHDQDPMTPCQLCAICEAGESETRACSPGNNRLCETCESDEYDHDLDPITPCVPCVSECTSQEVSFGICSPTTSRECAPCETNPSQVRPQMEIPSDPQFEECPALDPFCEERVDLLVLYTPAMLSLLDEDQSRLQEMVYYWVNLANQSLINSILPPTMRYRLVGVQAFSYEERGRLKSDLLTLRHHPRAQALRKRYGADVVVYLLGTQGYGGFAYSNSGRGTTYDERGVVVIDGHYFTLEYNQCGTVYETAAHELGHIFGCGHRASQFRNPSGTSYGYHNQEPHLRRNEAYGRAVDQHDQAVFTLMSYKSYDNEFGQIQGCVECRQLAIFSSSKLWWFFDEADPLYGSCLVVNELELDPDSNEVSHVDLACRNSLAWGTGNGENPADDGYHLVMDSLETISVEDLLSRAIPLGVDHPTYQNPEPPREQIQMDFQTDNRQRVIDFWSDKSDNASPKASLADCPQECAAQGRSRCAVGALSCGSCLPEFIEDGEECVGLLEIEDAVMLNDDEYTRSDWLIPSQGAEQDWTLSLLQSATLTRLELYLRTLDDDLNSDYSWTSIGSTIWVANEAPPHSFELYAHHPNGTQTQIAAFNGISDTDLLVIQDIENQKNHALIYRVDIPETLDAVDELRLVFRSAHEVGQAMVEGAFGFSVDELKVFGQPR